MVLKPVLQRALRAPTTLRGNALEKAVMALFAGGAAQGVWYDPADLATLFQDSAGTTPVTAVEQPVGLLLDKRLGLARGPEQIVDREFDDPSKWQVLATGPATATITGGKATIVSPAGESASIIQTPGAGVSVVGKTYEFIVDVESYTGSAGVHFSGAAMWMFTAGAGIKRIIATADGAQFGVKRGGACNVVIRSISVRELAGNHASQATAAARPTLSARKNLLTQTADLTHGAYGKTLLTVVASPTYPGLFGLTDTAATGNHYLSSPTFTPAANTDYTASYDFAAGLQPRAQVRMSNANGGCIAVFDLVAGTTTAQSTYGTGWTVTSRTIVPLGNGVYRCSITAKSVDAISVSAGAFCVSLSSDNYAGNTSAPAIHAGNPQVEIGAASTRYQRVTTATDYDAVGFPHYLKFDGVDDGLQTAAFDLSSTNKLTVCAGIHKASDAAVAMVAELGNSGTPDAGSFALLAPITAAAPNYALRSVGGGAPSVTTTRANGTEFAAPHTAVLTGESDIAAPFVALRINGVAGAPNTAPQVAGNYSATLPLFIGRRTGTTLPFNGRLYGLVVRGAASTAAQIAAAERYLAAKSGVTLP